MSQVTDKTHYKHIFKSTSLFGGVQVIQVIATLLRAKFAAVFLGTVGMGISSLFLSSITVIQTIASLGLNTSAVREISKAKESEDYSKLSKTITIFQRLILFSALLGFLLIVALAPWLSGFVFGNSKYIFEYVCLSVFVGLSILGGGYATILQGTRRLRDLAKANVLSAIFSVLVAIPIYYFFRIKGIVFAFVLSSAVSLIIGFLFARKVKFDRFTIGVKKTIIDGSEMVKLGVVMMLTSLMGTSTILLINVFITRYGSFSDVGLYQAGMNITNQSIGLVFNAMGVDYFPRLSAVSDDFKKIRSLVNQQSEVMLLIVTPILLLLILTTPLIIRVLLNSEFLLITNFIRLIALGTFFQAANYAMGLISFSKGDKKIFLIFGIEGNLQWLLFSIIGYMIHGLIGVAIFFVVHSIICYFIVYYVAYKKYNFLMSKAFTKLLLTSSLIMILISGLVIFLPNFLGYLISVAIFCFYILYSISKLNELIGLKGMIYKIIKKLK